MERSQGVRALLDLADVVDIPTAAEGNTGQQEQDEATGDYFDQPQALAQALYERQVPVVWNDLIREVERIRRRKNQSPLSASWHRNVGIALKHCPFELAEATPEAIREWIDQMQDSGLVV